MVFIQMYLAQNLITVPRLQRKIEMTFMTLESKVKVISFLQSNYMGAQAGLRLYNIISTKSDFLGIWPVL